MCAHVNYGNREWILSKKASASIILDEEQKRLSKLETESRETIDALYSAYQDEIQKQCMESNAPQKDHQAASDTESQ